MLFSLLYIRLKRYTFINAETQGLEACFQNMTPVFTLLKTTQEQPYSVVLQ